MLFRLQIISLLLKRCSFKSGFIVILIFALPENGASQNLTLPDSMQFRKFLPDYVKFQYAGGIGFVSTGVGYTFFNEKLDVSYFYSYIPHMVTEDDLHSVSLQITSRLLRYNLSENAEVLPLNIGFFVHHTFGNKYWIKQPAHYPDNYYWWAPGRNAGLFIGGEIKTKLLSNITPASGTAFYFRVGSRVLYLVSIVGNSEIPLHEVLEFGFGLAIYR